MNKKIVRVLLKIRFVILVITGGYAVLDFMRGAIKCYLKDRDAKV